jgi:hypothetical protein
MKFAVLKCHDAIFITDHEMALVLLSHRNFLWYLVMFQEGVGTPTCIAFIGTGQIYCGRYLRNVFPYTSWEVT